MNSRKRRHELAVRVNITLPPRLLDEGKRLVPLLFYTDFSDLVQGLIREKIMHAKTQMETPAATA